MDWLPSARKPGTRNQKSETANWRFAMDTILQDVRYGIRMMRKSPMVTLVAVISLALGISANTVIFSVVNAILLKSLPYNEPDRIVLAWGDIPGEGKHRTQVSATDVDDW